MFGELKQLLKHGSVYGLGNVLNKAIGFLLIPFYTRYLSTGDYGTLELLDLSAALVGLLFNVWMNASLIRFYYEYDNPRDRNSLVATALIFTAGCGAVLSIVGICFSKQISTLVLKSPVYYHLVWIIVGNLFVTSIASVLWSYLRALQRSTLIVLLNGASLALMLGLNIYFLAVLKTGFAGILYGSLIANTIVTLGLVAMVVRQVGVTLDLNKVRGLAAFGLPLIFTSLSAFELNFADRFFLQHYSTVSVVGLYALGYKFGFMLSFLIIQPFIMIWGARMYEVAKRQDAAKVMSRVFSYFSLLLSAVALVLSLSIKEIVSVIAAPDFHDAWKVTPVVALAYVFYGIAYCCQTGLYVAKKTSRLGLIGVICAATNIGLNVLLIPHYAAQGAAWATCLSFFIMAGLTYALAHTVYTISFRVHQIAAFILLAVGTYVVSTLVRTPSLLLSVGLKLGLLTVFGAGACIVVLLDKQEAHTFRRALKLAWQRVG